MTNKKLVIAANWKMNPCSIEDAINLVTEIIDKLENINEKIKLIFFVPFPFIYPISKLLETTDVLIGAQDCYTELSGAYTGSVSVSMLKSLGCSYIIAGHSERREIFNDTNLIINRKVNLILDAGLNCILCIGENKEEYENGLNKTVCDKQLTECLLNCEEKELDRVIIAYEPVWAIGTGLNATSEHIKDVHKYIRDWIEEKYCKEAAEKICIQYGGSVNPDNVNGILIQDDVDGVLVGGSSLDSNKFRRLINNI